MLNKDIYIQVTAKVYVFSESVPSLDGKCPPYPESVRVWVQDIISYFVSTPKCRIGQHRWRTVCVRVEDFPRAHNKTVLQEIEKLKIELRIPPQDFEDRIIFRSMYNDIDRTAKNNASIFDNNSSEVSE